MLRTLAILLICLMAISCHEQDSDTKIGMGKYTIPQQALEIAPPRTAPPPIPPGYAVNNGIKIIKNGDIQLEVPTLEPAKLKVDSILDKYGGYYEHEQFNSYQKKRSYSFRIRVPYSKFDPLISELESGMGRLKSKNIAADDVTLEYKDLNIRMKNNLAYLNQYKVILKKATSVKDILEVQEKLRTIEEEIDSKKGRLAYLDSKVALSTLNLELTEPAIANLSKNPSLTSRLFHAFHNGFKSFINLILSIIRLWPFVLLIIVLIWARKPILKRLRFGKRKNNLE